MKKLLLFICCCLMSSCCSFVSTGAALDAVGRQVPAIQQTQVKGISRFSPDYAPSPTTIWKKGELYYVELPVVYVPMRESWFSYCYAPGRCVHYPSALSAAELDARQSQPQSYYAELNEKQLAMATASLRKFERSPLADEKFRVLKAGEVDLSGARKLSCSDPDIICKSHYFLSHLPDKRTLGNQMRRPLCWALVAVDAPLSVGATALGWSLMILLGPFF